MIFAVAGDLCLNTTGDTRKGLLDEWLAGYGMNVPALRTLYAAMCTYMGETAITQGVQLMVEAWLFSPRLRHRTTVDVHLCAWFGAATAAWKQVLGEPRHAGDDLQLHKQWVSFLLDHDSRCLPHHAVQLVPTVVGMCFTSPMEPSAASPRVMPDFLRGQLHGFAGQRRVRFLDWAPSLWIKWEPLHHETDRADRRRMLPLFDPEQHGVQAFLKRKRGV